MIGLVQEWFCLDCIKYFKWTSVDSDKPPCCPFCEPQKWKESRLPSAERTAYEEIPLEDLAEMEFAKYESRIVGK